MPITEGGWTVKVRTGDPSDEEKDDQAWQGVVPVRTITDRPIPAPWVDHDRELPPSVLRLRADGWDTSALPNAK